jgi:hypothetical protein
MQRNRRLIYAIPIIILLTALVIYQYGFQGIRDRISTLREERAISMEKLKRYNALISEGPAIEARLEELRRVMKEERAKLIEAQTASLAAATLQNIIKEMFTAHGGTISSERIEKTEDLGGFRVVSATINGMLPDTDTLREILYAIETHTPYLVVKSLDVRVRNYRRPTGALTVYLTVSALTSAR